jgi:hypothetical protein
VSCRAYSLLAFFSAALLASCGIDEIVYLDSPSGTAVDATSQLIVYHVANQSPDMLGYEVFYRIYADKDKALADYSTISGYNTSYPTSVKTLIVNSLKFSRLSTKYIDASAPLVTVGYNKTNVTMVFDFSQVFSGIEPYVSVTGDVTDSFFLYRGISSETTPTEGMKFIDLRKTSTDSDFDRTNFDSTSDFFYILFCVFTYGIDDSFNPIYSTALILGPFTTLTYPHD